MVDIDKILASTALASSLVFIISYWVSSTIITGFSFLMVTPDVSTFDVTSSPLFTVEDVSEVFSEELVSSGSVTSILNL